MKKTLLAIGLISLILLTPSYGVRRSYLIQNELVISTNATNSVTGNAAKFMFLARNKDQNNDRVKGVGLIHPVAFGSTLTTGKIPSINLTYFPKAKLDIVVSTNHTFLTDVTKRHLTRTGIFGFSESNDQFTTTAINLNESSDLEAENPYNHFEFMVKFVSGNNLVSGVPTLNARIIDFGPTHLGEEGGNAGIVLKSVKGLNKKTESYAGINLNYWGSINDYYARPTASLEVWGDVASTGLKGIGSALPLFGALHKIGAYRKNLEGMTFDFTNSELVVKFYSHTDVVAANGGVPATPTKALRFTGFSDATNPNVDTIAEAKNFTIDHPMDSRRYLIHAMIEAPENRVYYRGEVKLKRGKALVKLPDYVQAFTHEDGVHIQLTSVDSFDRVAVMTQKDSKIYKGKFLIKSENPNSKQTVHWEVSAVRSDIARLKVEPHKSEITVHGTAPYLYYTPK